MFSRPQSPYSPATTPKFEAINCVFSADFIGNMTVRFESPASPQLENEIAARYGCKCHYAGTFFLRPRGHQASFWDGAVNLYKLMDCPVGETAFAWKVQDDSSASPRVLIYLQTPSISSPFEAVAAAIEAGEMPKSERLHGRATS